MPTFPRLRQLDAVSLSAAGGARVAELAAGRGTRPARRRRSRALPVLY